MYRLLIVEDEKWEREGLVDFLDWSELGIQIAGTAANGVQGLKLAKEYQPDIILTDIRMPIMDGMEFTRVVRQFLPDCRIVIITGYDDFEYAKEAIQLSVYEYLLKPVQKDQLLDVLNKTVKGLSDEINQVEYVRVLKDQIAESMYEDRERFLLNVIEGNLNHQKDLAAADYFNVTYHEQVIVAVIIRFDAVSFSRGRQHGEIQIPLRDLFRMIRKTVGEDGITAQNPDRTNEMIICMPTGGDGRNHIYDVIRRIRQGYYGTDIPEAVIGVGSVSKTLQGFAVSFLQAKVALDHIFFMKDTVILFYEDIPHRENIQEPEAFDFFACAAGYSKKVVNGVASLDSQEVTSLSDELFEFIDHRSIGKDLLCNFFAGLISELSTLLLSNNESFTFKIINEDILETLYEFIKLEDLKIWFQELLLHANYCITERKNNKEEYIVGKVMDIIRKEYVTSIGIETIARRLELSPNYLGGLFKQHMGERFTDILTDFRMKKAEELLVSGTGTVIEASKAVGFVNVAYFCTVFKKTHGISPLDYQKEYFKKKDKDE